MNAPTVDMAKIDKNTGVSIAVVVVLCAALVAFARWQATVDAAGTAMQHQIKEQSEQIKAQSAVIAELAEAVRQNTMLFQTATNDRWRKSDERAIWYEFGELNPELKVPLVK